MHINLSDYVAGGYFITKYADEGFWKSELMPERVVSVSTCISKILEISWGWNTVEHKEEIESFGIDTAKLQQLRAWCGEKKPGALYTLEVAREFIAEFLPQKHDVLLVGVGLPNNLVGDFLQQNWHIVLDTNTQVQSKDLWSIGYVLSGQKPLPEGGKPLGFEVISYFASTFSDTWLCSLLEREMYELFNIRTNEYGLINSLEEARKVYEWIAEDKMQGKRAEPLPYHPWLLVQYPLT
jgi:hypothetical protein